MKTRFVVFALLVGMLLSGTAADADEGQKAGPGGQHAMPPENPATLSKKVNRTIKVDMNDKMRFIPSIVPVRRQRFPYFDVYQIATP